MKKMRAGKVTSYLVVIIASAVSFSITACKKDSTKPSTTDIHTKTLNVTTAGTLYTVLNETERDSLRNITITGSIDARDFVTLRDLMPKLTVIDISGVQIMSYVGLRGTYYRNLGAYGDTDITYAANAIPAYAFYNSSDGGGENVTTIKIPSSVTAIGDYAFHSCNSLRGFIIKPSVTSIGIDAFESTNIDTITIPPSITAIAEGLFCFCFNIKTITIPSSVTTIGNYAFEDCSSLTSVIIPTSVTSIGISAFLCCSSLTSITIPSSVTKIEVGAFSGCKSLKQITIPSSVTTIWADAFSQCTGLTSITIPSSVTAIQDNAFTDCSTLTAIYANAATPVNLSNSLTVFAGVPTSTCTLYVPKGSKAAYQAALQWSAFTNIIEQ